MKATFSLTKSSKEKKLAVENYFFSLVTIYNQSLLKFELFSNFKYDIFRF